MNDQADEVKKDDQSASVAGALATGGGNATAAGVTFQGAIGALFSATAIADRPLDARLGIGAVRVKELSFETEAPLDDILIATDAEGYVFVQAKTSLTLAKKLDSELGKTAEQIVRQWVACSGGDGALGWNRPLAEDRDSFLIAVGPGAAGTVANDLAQALSRRRRKATDATTPDDQKKALESFTTLLNLAWEKVVGSPATAEDIAQLLDLTAIVQFDMDGADRAVGVEILRSALLRSDDAPSAFDVLGGPDEPYLFGRLRVNGPDPEHRSYRSFASFSDPDGNGWLFQEITTRLPGRIDATATTFASANDLASAFRRAEAAHGEHEKLLGHRDEDWPDWYAAYMIAEQSGKELPQ